MIVTGTRQSGLIAAESPAPIQIISPAALKAASGNPDVMATLAQVIPSLSQQAFGADQAGQTLQIKLRGLSPNDVLILISSARAGAEVVTENIKHFSRWASLFRRMGVPTRVREVHRSDHPD